MGLRSQARVRALYVSTSGSDAQGVGTANQPFATIQHAIAAALANQRTLFGGGINGTINVDTVVVARGRYTGIGNVGLAPLGKVVHVLAVTPAEVVIDCSDTDMPEFASNNPRQSAGSSNSGVVHVSGINTENCLNSNFFSAT